jgi:hypothetical protein
MAALRAPQTSMMNGRKREGRERERIMFDGTSMMRYPKKKIEMTQA